MKSWNLFFVLTIMLVSATRLASAQSSGAAVTQRVLIAPFLMADLPEAQRWMPKSIQDNLVASFSRAPGFAAVPYKGGVLADDNTTAARLAKSASANLAVRGSAVLENDNVHLTAQLVDAKTGEALSSADVSGPAVNLLKLEEQLSTKLREPRPRTAVAVQAAPLVASSSSSSPSQVPPADYPEIPPPPAYTMYTPLVPYTPMAIPSVTQGIVYQGPFRIDLCTPSRAGFIVPAASVRGR